jgi:hypothetical protein
VKSLYNYEVMYRISVGNGVTRTARIPRDSAGPRHRTLSQASIEPCANCDALPFVFVILWE